MIRSWLMIYFGQFFNTCLMNTGCTSHILSAKFLRDRKHIQSGTEAVTLLWLHITWVKCSQKNNAGVGWNYCWKRPIKMVCPQIPNFARHSSRTWNGEAGSQL